MKLCLMAAGNFNVGDNALLHSWLSVLDGVLSSKDMVYVLGIEPSYVMQFSSRYRYRVSATNVLYRYFAVCPDEAHMQMRLNSSLFDDVPCDEFSYELRQIKEIFADIDLLHIIGGGIINCMWLDMQYLNMAAIELAKKNGKRVIMTGQTLGPLNDVDKSRLLPYLQKVDLLDLRDDCPWLKEAGIDYQVTVDDVLAYMQSAYICNNLPWPLNELQNNRFIAVCLQSWDLPEFDRIKYTEAKENIAAFLNEVLMNDREMQIYFLEFMHLDHDKANNQEVYALLSDTVKNRCRFITCSNFYPFTVSTFVAKARFCITTRLHLSIFALRASVPVCSLVLDEYYRKKMEGAYKAFSVNSVFTLQECTKENIEYCYLSGRTIKIEKGVKKLIGLKYEKVMRMYKESIGSLLPLYFRKLI